MFWVSPASLVPKGFVRHYFGLVGTGAYIREFEPRGLI
jgi:hypothetical protein